MNHATAASSGHRPGLTEDDYIDLDDETFIDVPTPRYAAKDNEPSLSNHLLLIIEGRALAYHHRTNEGASFHKLAPHVDIITCTGAQYLHSDRHLSGTRFNGLGIENTWNYVVHSDGGQLLLVEVAEGVFEHIDLSAGTFVYFNTFARHMISRSDPTSMVIIVQVSGYGPNEDAAAAAEMKRVLEQTFLV